ncbi:peptidoglycan D,D-transpeptidase FtsI family protein [Sphingomonas sp. ID0503]|uniref:peptidoglycan D,D-transpeptidase FtsI family protein n=1 Tax=Sphingomonas sp. ID0503 TaxID=3399691 RepID=UPI003AFB612E
MTAVALPRQKRIEPAGAQQEAVTLTHFRLMLVMLLFMGVAAVIASRLLFLAAFGDEASGGRRSALGIPPRADIVDRNGVPLARTIDAWSIAIHPSRLVNDPEDLAPKLAAMMPEKTEAQYLAMLRSGKNFAYLRRRAMPELVQAVNALGEPAIEFQREPERLYPQASLASHILGFTNREGLGVGGIEGAFEKRLIDPAMRDKPIQLSIDSRVQAVMESELYSAMMRFQAIGATGVVLNVRTGEVVALASLPSFNPNAPGRVTQDLLYNKATMGVYELGSTFKAITMANGIESGVLHSMAQTYDATASLQIGRFRINDDHPKRRFLSVPEIMVYSSNIGTARIAEELGQARELAMFRRLGFDRKVDIEIPEKSVPLLPGYWGRTTVMTVAYGHGIAVTPLHLANAYAALVNGGVLRPATLMKRDPDHLPAGRRVISEDTSFKVRQLMRMVVMPETGGTGKSANAIGFRVGGKTGTAEKASNGGYARHSLVTTFAGAFPMDDPKYIVLAMLDEPKGTKETYGFATAGWNAGPVVGKVIARVGPMLGVMPDENRDIDVSQLMPLVAPVTKGH